MYSSRGGINVNNTADVISGIFEFPSVVLSMVIPRGSVILSVELIKIIELKKLFHTLMKCITNAIMIVDLLIGKIILKKIVSFPAPSHTAASS